MQMLRARKNAFDSVGIEFSQLLAFPVESDCPDRFSCLDPTTHVPVCDNSNRRRIGRTIIHTLLDGPHLPLLQLRSIMNIEDMPMGRSLDPV